MRHQPVLTPREHNTKGVVRLDQYPQRIQPFRTTESKSPEPHNSDQPKSTVRLVVLYTSSICTNEPTGEDLYAGWINGRDKKGIPFRLGTWIGMIG